jgi:secreted trypsin-like serine protease
LYIFYLIFHITFTCNLQGDSGGALIYEAPKNTWTQIGIVSFGAGAGCTTGYPDAFTRVSSYLGWISDNTNITIIN